MGLWKRPELIWRVVLIAILLLAGLIWLPPQSVPSSSELELTIPQTPAGPKLVALTFDDGPRRDTTAALLDGLKEREVKATFFLIGKQIQSNCDLVLRMAQEGHQIGVHTFDHVQVTGLDYWSFISQVEGTRWPLYRLLGERELWLRPPYGIYDENVARWADSPVILWSVDPEDWKDENVQRITDHVVGRVKDGDIILMHDIYPSSVEAALAIVDTLLDRGYRFVTVERLLQERGIYPEIGAVYNSAPVQFRPVDNTHPAGT